LLELINYHQLGLELVKLTDINKRIDELKAIYESVCSMFALFIEAPHTYYDALSQKENDCPMYAMPLSIPQSVQAFPSQKPTEYQISAVDGSQAGPYKVAGWPMDFFLINIGSLVLTYGKSASCFHHSYPQLIVRENTDLALTDAIALNRKLAEYSEAIKLIDLHHQELALTLVDGSLIWWSLDLEKNENSREKSLETVLSFFDKAKSKKIIPIGYISGSQSMDLLNCLKAIYCSQKYPETKVKCIDCGDVLCQVLASLRDDYLLELYANNANLSTFISPLFESKAKIIKEYGEHRILFFYLYCQGECARIEFPAYHFNHLLWIQQCISDQLQKGHGYPVILSDVHQLAVVSENEKRELRNLIQQSLHEEGLILFERNKDLSKGMKYV
jgi:hypothetical protein